jgi:hypothetical protein
MASNGDPTYISRTYPQLEIDAGMEPSEDGGPAYIGSSDGLPGHGDGMGRSPEPAADDWCGPTMTGEGLNGSSTKTTL